MDASENRNFMKQNQVLWDEWASIHEKSEFYAVDKFIAGENKLHELELQEVGDVEGKNLLHLQCHFGMDTLSWARLGAHVTGVDFSEVAIEKAKELAALCRLDGRFVCSNLYDLPQNLMGQFDIVYTSYGVLSWLPDISRWAQIAAAYVKPGGFFYMVEMHPIAMVFDNEAQSLQIRYPYFEKKAMKFEVNGTYAEPNATTKNKEEIGWNHTLADILNGLIDNGLSIEYLHEFPFSVFQQFPFLEHDVMENIYRFPGGFEPAPLLFSLKARKDSIEN